MTAFSKHTIQLIANHIIPKLHGGILKVYGAGSAFPRHITHPIARCAVEFAQYQLATPCGIFDDTSGRSQIVFTPPTRLTTQVDAEGYPNFFRIYSQSTGEALYQGACRVIDYLDTGNASSETAPVQGILRLRSILPGNDVRYSNLFNLPETFNDTGIEWRRWPRWVDVEITSFAIDIGGAQ